MTKAATIFLSHNSQDKEFVRRLAGDLSRYGVTFWLDEAEIQVGDSLIEKIEQGILDMDFLGVVLSPASVDSNWVRREVEIALNMEIAGRSVRVLPLLLQDCAIPTFLASKAYADFRRENEYEASLFKLLRRLGIKEPREVTADSIPIQTIFISSNKSNPLVSFASLVREVVSHNKTLQISIDEETETIFMPDSICRVIWAVLFEIITNICYHGSSAVATCTACKSGLGLTIAFCNRKRAAQVNAVGEYDENAKRERGRGLEYVKRGIESVGGTIEIDASGDLFLLSLQFPSLTRIL